MQINGLGSSQSGELHYRNQQTQQQNTAEKAADKEENVILTLSSQGREEAQKNTGQNGSKTAEPQARSSTGATKAGQDWLTQLLERLKIFLLRIWNEDAPAEESAAEPMSEQGLEAVPEQGNVLAEPSVQELETEPEQPTNPLTELWESVWGKIKQFLANPFSEDAQEVGQAKQRTVGQKHVQNRTGDWQGAEKRNRQGQAEEDFAQYMAQNGWDDANIAHQLQKKSRPCDTYDRRGQHSQMIEEIPSSISMKR